MATIATARAQERKGTAFPFFNREAKRQVGWVDSGLKMGRAAHSDPSDAR
jgi:hypothetical protein